MIDWFWISFSILSLTGMFICLRGWMNAVDELCRLERCYSQAIQSLRESRDFIEAMGDRK